MAADLPILSGITDALAALAPVAIPGYFALIPTVTLTAVFSSKPHRREAAIEVPRCSCPAAAAAGARLYPLRPARQTQTSRPRPITPPSPPNL